MSGSQGSIVSGSRLSPCAPPVFPERSYVDFQGSRKGTRFACLSGSRAGSPNRPLAQTADQLGINRETLRNWVQQDRRDRGLVAQARPRRRRSARRPTSPFTVARGRASEPWSQGQPSVPATDARCGFPPAWGSILERWPARSPCGELGFVRVRARPAISGPQWQAQVSSRHTAAAPLKSRKLCPPDCRVVRFRAWEKTPIRRSTPFHIACLLQE